MSHAEATWSAAERAARDSYGRLLAWLAYRWRDLAAAEDALAEAFASALETWQRDGIPDSPDAWLLTAAKRNLLQMHRHRKVTEDPAVSILFAEETVTDDFIAVPDNRLNLMFVCAHPAIDVSVRTALMLQTVLGLDATHIASAFLVSPSAMAQRLVRAKSKIRDAGIRFDPPEASELSARLDAVLDGIYAAFGISWDTLGGAETTHESLADEAIFLGRVLLSLLPEEPEVAGLLALMMFSHARRGARLDASGLFVPLAEHDTTRWDRAMIMEADTLLLSASVRHRPGPFQIEAAIQSAHCHRLFSGHTPWPAIAQLYQALVSYSQTAGVAVGHAVAVAEAGNISGALVMLDALPTPIVANYQPWWVARAHICQLAGQQFAARSALGEAIGLTTQDSVRAYLLKKAGLDSSTAL